MQLFHEVMGPGRHAYWAILKTDAASMPKKRVGQIGWAERTFDANVYPRHVLRSVRENGYVALEYLRGLRQLQRSGA